MLLDVNVIGIVNAAASCRPHMAARGGGAVVNLSSIAGFDLCGAYGVSKLAVRGLTNALAKEFGDDNIRVCSVAPGMVHSPSAVRDVPVEKVKQLVNELQVIKRAGQMEDVVRAVLFLCSDNSSFITGETLLVSGGYPMRP